MPLLLVLCSASAWGLCGCSQQHGAGACAKGNLGKGFWAMNASGTAWLLFSNKSIEEVWENRRERTSPSQKGAEIITKKRRRSLSQFKFCQCELRDFLTSARVQAVSCCKGLLSWARREVSLERHRAAPEAGPGSC